MRTPRKCSAVFGGFLEVSEKTDKQTADTKKEWVRESRKEGRKAGRKKGQAGQDRQGRTGQAGQDKQGRAGQAGQGRPGKKMG